MRHKLSIALFLAAGCLTVLAQSQTYNIYFGNLHAHTAYSDGNKDSSTSGVSNPYGSWLYAKNTHELDFLGISEHNHSTAGLLLSNWYKGIAQRDSFMTYATDTNFAVLFGQEYGVISSGGHLLVYGTDKLFGWEAGNYQVYVSKYDYTALFNAVRANGGFCLLAHPQSADYNNLLTTYNSAADGVVLGTALSSGPAFSTNTTQTDPATSGVYEPRYHDALKRGYRVGANIDQDTHYTNFGMANQERTAVLATARTPAAILDALRHRRFYATMDKNLRISMTVNGAVMGEEVTTAGQANISVSVSDPDAGSTTKIEIRYGVPGSGSAPTVLASTTSSSSLTYQFNQTDGSVYYYYAYVEQTQSSTVRSAWTSPVWNHRNEVGLAAEPTNQATGLSVTASTSSSLTFSWTNAVAGAQAPSAYLVEISSSNVFFDPADGTGYSDDTNISDGNGVVNKANDATTSYTFTGLDCGTTYYVRMYSYNGSGTSINYKIDGTIPAISGVTTSSSPASEPTNYPNGFELPTVTNNSITLRWNDTTGAVLATGYLLSANISGTFIDPVDGVAYPDDGNLADGEAAVNVAYGVKQYTFSNLPASTSYVFKLYPYNGSSCSRNYKTAAFPGTLNPVYTTLASGTATPSVVVNEYLNTGSNDEWLELLTLTDSLNMQGVKIRDYSSSGSLQNVTAPFYFTAAPEWESVRKGTFIVIFRPTVAFTEATDFSTKSVKIRTDNTYYFSSPLTPFLFAADHDALEIYTETNTHIHALSHGSQPGFIASIPQPRANSTSTPASGQVVRFVNTASAADFADNSKTGISSTSTPGTPNDATQTTFVNTVLPVELVMFNAFAQRTGATLMWQTATETNNYGFEIERKAVSRQQSAYSWQKVGFIAGSGTSSSPREYSFADANLVSGRYAYRLKQIDNDGSSRYSSAAEVEVGLAPNEFKLEPNFPNPFNPSTTIEFTVGTNGPAYRTDDVRPAGRRASLRVFNLLGQEVATLFDGEAQAGRVQQVKFDASRLPSGLYFAKLEAGKQQIIRKMILVK